MHNFQTSLNSSESAERVGYLNLTRVSFSSASPSAGNAWQPFLPSTELLAIKLSPNIASLPSLQANCPILNFPVRRVDWAITTSIDFKSSGAGDGAGVDDLA